MEKSPVPTTMEQQHSSLQTPKAGKHHSAEQGGHKELSPHIFPLEEPPSADTSQDKPPLHRREWKSLSTAAPAHPALGFPPLSLSCPAPPSPHLSQKKLSICGRCGGDGRLAGEASGHLRASRPGWPGALGRGQRTPPPASLNALTAQLFLR